MSGLRVGSLFAGVGGFDLGLERAGGFKTAWFCEQDEFCQRVLAKHWPGVPCYDDITRLEGCDVEPVDVLCGGFPCQDISLAGTGAGLAGTRSGLWSEYARLIGELRPRYVLVENVSALLARGMGTVLADLAEIGYDAEWDCIPASAVGAPHRRDRVWFVAYPNSIKYEGDTFAVGRASAPFLSADPNGDDGRQRRQGRLDPSGARERVAVAAFPDAAESGLEGFGADTRQPEVAESWNGGALDNTLRGRHGAPEREVRAGWNGSVHAGWWAVEPDVGRVAHGVPARVDRLRSLGNALVPQIAEWIGMRVLEFEDQVVA